LKSSFPLTALSILFFLPTSYLFFELDLYSQLLELSNWLIIDTLGLHHSGITNILLYCISISIIYIPTSIWIACCMTTCLAVSNGYHPNFRNICSTTSRRFGSVLIARILTLCIILMPSLIMSFFTNHFTHIIPMYGQVIVPAIAYFTLYLSLRYVFVEAIVIAERASPMKAITLCNKITEGATLRIFLLQQVYLICFIAINWAAYAFIDNTLALSNQSRDWLLTTPTRNLR